MRDLQEFPDARAPEGTGANRCESVNPVADLWRLIGWRVWGGVGGVVV